MYCICVFVWGYTVICKKTRGDINHIGLSVLKLFLLGMISVDFLHALLMRNPIFRLNGHVRYCAI